MILLTSHDHTLSMITSAAVSVDWSVHYVDRSPTAPDLGGSTSGNVSTATTTEMLACPPSTQRRIELLTVRNRSTTTANSVTITKSIAGTAYHVTPVVTLQPGEMLEIRSGVISVVDITARQKVVNPDRNTLTGYPLQFYKVGITTEAAGVDYTWALNTGFPGAWSPGTEGVDGRATDGTDAADAGCLPYANAASGANYLTGFSGSTTVACRPYLMDVLWVNDALDVTDTDPQVIATPAWPARDNGGAVAGKGVNVGILVTGATGNGGAVTNITLEYTNSAGVASRTATMASFPASATAGTIVWFQLEAGDVGVKSIEGITIGTTLASGTISLIAARRLASFSSGLVNVGASAAIDPTTGIRLYDGSCLLLAATMSTTTATNIEGEAFIANR